MPEIATLFIKVVVPVFLLIALGYGYSARKEVDVRLLTELIMFVLAPCLVLHSILTMEEIGPSLARLPVAAVLSLTLLLTLAFLVFRPLERRVGRSLRGMVLPVAFSNGGNMGLPTTTLMFGTAGLRVAVVFFLCASFLHYTVGVAIARGDASGVREAVRLPLVYAMALGLLMRAFGLEMPAPVMVPIEMLGGATLAMMLFALGCQLRRTPLRALRLAFLASMLRLAGGFGVAHLVAPLVGLVGLHRQVFILLSVMPSAVMNFPIAQRYDANPDEVSSTILVSTVLSLVAIPLVLASLG